MIPEPVRNSVDYFIRICEQHGFTIGKVDVIGARDSDLPDGVTVESIEDSGDAFEYADHLHVQIFVELPEATIISDAVKNVDRLRNLAESLSGPDYRMGDARSVPQNPSDKVFHGRVISCHITSTPMQICGIVIHVLDDHKQANLN